MVDLLTRAGCFIGIIVLGFLLKQWGVFRDADFSVLSKVVVRITLPAAIVTSFAGKQIEPSLLVMAGLGVLTGLIYVGLGFVLNWKTDRERQAFEMLNLTGYNVGCFTMPFAQSFLGPTGVIVTSLFDSGNAFMCLGTAFGLASTVKDGSGFDLKRVLRALLRSVPFVTYILMTALNLAQIGLPGPILSFAKIAGDANPFVAMLMVGVGFRVSGDRKQWGAMARLLAVRYGTAAVFALLCWFVLPFSLEARQALVILMFAPIANAVPAFTEEMKSDVGLSSAINSISVVISIVILLILLPVIL